jgi:hypothetical protein
MKPINIVMLHKKTSELFLKTDCNCVFAYLIGDYGRYYLEWNDEDFIELGEL